MASFDLSEEINCSICLDIYTDPVMLPCGHNFCQGCIGRVLDTQEGTVGYSCPECREEYKERPVLQRNRTLGNIAKRFLPGQLAAGEAGVPCTYCVHSPVSAVKSCLHCETSLCDVHLTAHNKSLEHVLTDPTASFSNRKCSTHKELLKYYCLEDKACICSSCCLAGEHRGHRVELLSEASEKKKEKLRKVLEKLSPEREETERGAQRLQERRREVEEKVASETERVTALFKDIREKVEALEKRFLDEISSQKEKLSSRLRDLIEQLEIKKDELSRKIRHIEELCNMADPLTVLQERESHGDDFCGAEVGNDDEGGEEALNCFAVLASEEEQYSDQFYSDDEELYLDYEENEEATNLEALDEDLHLLLRHLNEVVTSLNKIIIGQEATDLVLDINTAANDVTVSSDRKYVYYACPDQCHPQTPERFQSSQVLSSRSFISGRHYWDIAVDEYVCWKVGVAYPSIEREGDQSFFGKNHVSWCLGSYGNDYVVQHVWNVARLWRSSTCSRIRISVDCEAGFLSFYELNETVRHLYTFTVSFTEPLHAAFSVWDGYDGLKIIS